MPAPAVATQRKALAQLKRHGLTRLADFRTAVSPPPRWAEWSKLASRTTRARPVPTPDAALDPHQSLAKAARLVMPRFGARLPWADRPDAAQGLDRHRPEGLVPSRCIPAAARGPVR